MARLISAILADIASNLVQTLRDLHQKTLPSVQGAIASNKSTLSSFRESTLKTTEGQTQAIQAQDTLIKEHSSLIKNQAALLNTQSQATEEVASLIKNVPASAPAPTPVVVFNDADRALLTDMTTLMQRCLSAEVQVRQPAVAERERTFDTSEPVNVESDEEGDDEDDEENPEGTTDSPNPVVMMTMMLMMTSSRSTELQSARLQLLVLLLVPPERRRPLRKILLKNIIPQGVVKLRGRESNKQKHLVCLSIIRLKPSTHLLHPPLTNNPSHPF